MRFQTPPLYFIIHVLLGMISYFYQDIIPIFLLYQFTQLALDGRFFLFQWEFKSGNSLTYTLYKLTQYMIGYAIMYVYSVCY